MVSVEIGENSKVGFGEKPSLAGHGENWCLPVLCQPSTCYLGVMTHYNRLQYSMSMVRYITSLHYTTVLHMLYCSDCSSHGSDGPSYLVTWPPAIRYVTLHINGEFSVV